MTVTRSWTTRVTRLGGLLLAATGLLLLLGGASPAQAQTPETSGDSSRASITSDKADYPPGATVVLTGAGWAAGETVRVSVNDDEGQSWRRDVDVTADEWGAFTDTFSLPDWFVATYSVLASGPVSGQATWTFTDGNFVFQEAASGSAALPAGSSFSFTFDRWNNSTTCTGGASVSGTSVTVVKGGTTSASINTNHVIRLNAVTPPAGFSFAKWATSPGGAALTNLCFQGPNSALDLYAHFTRTNSAPTAGAVAITPASPTTSSVLTATPSGFADADGDALSYTFAWFKNGSATAISGATGSTLDLGGVSDHGSKGDAFRVTATASDGTVSSPASALSAAVTVVNSVPSAGAVAITPASPTTSSVLTATPSGFADADGDALSYTFAWFKNGSATAISGATGSTLDLGGVSDHGSKGDAFRVTATASDGTVSSPASALSAAVTVVNSVPSAGAVAITPASPTTSSVLTATPSGFADADGDALSYTFAWFKNGSATAISGATGSTLDLGGVSDHGSKGDAFRVTATASDGTVSSPASALSAAVTVVNSAPTGAVTLSPASPTTDGTLTATPAFTDADGDALSYGYQWFNGTTELAATGSTLDLGSAGYGDKGDAVRVVVTATDTSSASSAPTEDTVTVVNSAPTAGTVAITPASPTTSSVLTATPSGFADADGDALSYGYQWFNGLTELVGEDGSTLDLGSAGHGDKGDAVRVVVTATDTSSASSAPAEDTVTVVNSAPTAGTVAITPASPTTSSVLTATPAGFSDADGDALSYGYQWFNGLTELVGEDGSTLDLGSAGHGDKGDAVRVVVTATDTSSASSSPAEDTVTVVNSAPSAGTVAITPASPTTSSVLTATPSGFTDADGDALSYGYQWFNGLTELVGEDGSTLDLATAGHGDKGDAVRVVVTATDTSSASSSPAEDTVTVVNSAPTAGTVAITPASPTTSSVLTATPSGFSDADGDALSYGYQWFNGTTELAATGSTLDLATAGHGDKGDAVRVVVTATDTSSASSSPAEDTVTVVNSAPTGAVTLSPASPTTDGTLTATPAFTDADGDALSYGYQWFNGTTELAATGSTLDLASAGHGDKGDAVRVVVTATDTSSASSSPVEDTVTVVNSAPTAGAVAITPASPTTSSVLTATPSGFADADGDALSYTFAWFKNGSATAISGATGSTLDLGGVSDHGSKGDAFRVTATASDGTVSSPASALSAAVTVVNSVPSAGAVAITPASPTTSSVLTATPSGFADADGDALSYGYQWFNGTTELAATGSTLDLATAGHGDKGDAVRVVVTATDTSSASSTPAEDTVTVANSAPVFPAAPAAAGAQYSDSLSLLVAATDADGDPLVYSASGLPAGVTVDPATGRVSGTVTGAPGTYAGSVSAYDGTATTTKPVTITVTREDARTTYTGATFASTSSATSSTGVIALSTTVQDITAVTGDPAHDSLRGDVRNARVTFVNRDSGSSIPGCVSLPVGLVSSTDTTTGTASCNWSASTGSGDSTSFTVGTVVSGHYQRDSSAENAVVTLSKPIGSNFITGGGFVLPTASAGTYKADPGTKNNFGFNVKYNKSNTNLQGSINTIVRSGGRVYQIKGNAMSSLSVTRTSAGGDAIFNGSANVTDITDPLNPISKGGGAQLQVRMSDLGEPGSSDTISIQLQDKQGGLLYSSSWNGTSTQLATLRGGNLSVR